VRQPVTQRPKRRFRTFFMVLLLGVVGFIMYAIQCGDGLGFGPGSGTGTGTGDDDRDRVDRGEKPEPEASDVRPAVGDSSGPRRCRLRLDASGLTLDGRTSTVEDAVSACKKAGGAELTPTGDAVYGQLQKVREALDRAGVEVFERSPGTVPER
jgi:hypothetical protein